LPPSFPAALPPESLLNRSRQEKVLILRLWYEPREVASAEAVLRGTVVDVETGEQQSVVSLAEIGAVIEARLRQLRSKQGDAQEPDPTG